MPRFAELYVAKVKGDDLFIRFSPIPQSSFNRNPPKVVVETCISAEDASLLFRPVLTKEQQDALCKDGIEAEVIPIVVETKVHF